MTDFGVHWILSTKADGEIVWCPRQLFAFRRQQLASAVAFLSSIKERRIMPAPELITTDLGALWILSTKEDGKIAKFSCKMRS